MLHQSQFKPAFYVGTLVQLQHSKQSHRTAFEVQDIQPLGSILAGKDAQNIKSVISMQQFSVDSLFTGLIQSKVT